MDQILGQVGKVPNQSLRNDDDFADRFSYRYTAIMLVVASVIVTSKQYVGQPIDCWVPAHFTKGHLLYANSYCWVRNTYYVPFEEYLPQEEEAHLRDVIPYYQWTPIILLMMALGFYMPCMLWRSMNHRSGIDVNNIVESAETFQNTDRINSQEMTMKSMTRQLDRYLRNISQQSKPDFTFSIKNIFARTCCACFGRRHGNYLISLYLFCKILYIANVVAQFFILNYVMGMSYNLLGFNFLSAITQGEDWNNQGFPRVTMCDLKIRRLGNVQRYTVQCVLSINLFNEAIFLFVWFWMVLVALLSVVTFLSWAYKFAFSSDGVRYIKKHLHIQDKLEDESSYNDDESVKEFTNKYLQSDGVFVMRLVGHNTNAITATEYICSMWDTYNKIDEDEK